MKRRGALPLAMVLTALAILLCTGVGISLSQCPEAPPYKLLPPNWPCPAIPTCGTQYGVCRLPYFAAAGQPCYCQAADGSWIPGVCTRGSPGR
jgi:hypothetical protein